VVSGFIASTAGADKNRLDTGTLGFSDIGNRADYKVEHLGGSFSTGGPVGSQVLGNMASSLLSGLGAGGHAEGVTRAAVSDGTLIVRDQAAQKQDVSTLSHDTAGANGSISPIFDKEKEQKRLQTAQLVGEIAAQSMGVARTEGGIRAITAGKAELAKKNIPEPAAGDTRDAWDAYNEKLQNSSAYRDTQAEWGTGSDIQRGIQAATAVVQGLLAGSVQGAAAGATAPYLAGLIHKETTTSVNGNIQEVNEPANLIAHAVLGAVVAQLQDKNALAGAAGATTGEFIAQRLYPGVEHGKLSEEQKQKISALSTLAAGLAGSLASGDMSGTVAGASAGKNAVENNNLASALGAIEAQKKGTIAKYEATQKAICEQDQAACTQMVKDVAGTGLDFVPIVGDIKGFAEANTAIDYLAAAIGLIPGAGDVAGKTIRAAQTALKKGDVAEASRLINKASNDVVSVNYFGQERKYWSAEPVNVNGNKVYQRNDLFDPNAVDSRGRSNIQRMEKGLAPLDANGQSVNLHHMLQKQDGPIAEVTQSFHKDNHSVIHINDNSIPSGIDRNEFNKWRSDYWKQRSNDFKK